MTIAEEVALALNGPPRIARERLAWRAGKAGARAAWEGRTLVWTFPDGSVLTAEEEDLHGLVGLIGGGPERLAPE